ncbi:hypothetical protein GF395_04455, partial [Candidatus Uhrbacteria bacterium]|nr:hypothetical protein [Candidatus Uhrbacteria bacterium]
MDSTNFSSDVKVIKVTNEDPDTSNETIYNTDKRLLEIYRNAAVRKVNMHKKPMIILDGEDYGELIQLGGEVDYDKDGTAEFASSDISSTKAKYGTYSMDFNAGTECLLIPCTNNFKKESGTIAFWVYSADTDKILYENNAGWKIYTDSDGHVNFRITESDTDGASKATNTVEGTSDISGASWNH